jgi:hypothetical protein
VVRRAQTRQITPLSRPKAAAGIRRSWESHRAANRQSAKMICPLCASAHQRLPLRCTLLRVVVPVPSLREGYRQCGHTHPSWQPVSV